MKKKVCSVIIPNWNGEKWLKVCLPSLKKQTLKDFEILVVDNGSTDGSIDFIKSKFSDVKIIKLDDNYGFARAVNEGIKASSAELVVMLNNDIKLDKFFLKEIIDCFNRHKGSGMVSSRMRQFYNPELIDSAGDYIDVVGHADNIGRGDKDGKHYEIEREVFLVNGGASLFYKKMLNKIGLLDEDYFAYMEDVDLCLRAQLAGYRAWYAPKAIAYHVHKATSSKNKHLLEYWQFRNMTQTIIKDFPKELLLKNFNWLRILLVNLNTVIWMFRQGFGIQALRAEWFILTNFAKLLQKRKKIQSLRNVESGYFISNFKEKKLRIPIIGIRI